MLPWLTMGFFSYLLVLTLLRELNRAFEKTVVMVTHDPRAERFVDAVIRLDKGVLVNGAGAP